MALDREKMFHLKEQELREKEKELNRLEESLKNLQNAQKSKPPQALQIEENKGDILSSVLKNSISESGMKSALDVNGFDKITTKREPSEDLPLQI